MYWWGELLVGRTELGLGQGEVDGKDEEAGTQCARRPASIHRTEWEQQKDNINHRDLFSCGGSPERFF